MSDEMDAKIRQLVDDYFPWEDGHSRPSSTEQRTAHVLAWLRQRTGDHRRSALCLVALIQPILDELTSSVPAHERSRFIARVDQRCMEKSPESILEKMARSFQAGTPEFGFKNLHEMDDLARFRIVGNFLSDVQEVREALEVPYRSQQGRKLSPPQAILLEQYELRRNHFKDLIYVRPSERSKGERCFKGIFVPRSHPGLCVEVQIMTMLQEAWDKKDHCLIYERRRRGHVIDPRQEIDVFTLSEMLYGVDMMFDGLKQSVRASLHPSQPMIAKGGEPCE